MPLTGPIPEGHSFFCPSCGALYAVTYSRPSTGSDSTAKCVVCGQVMAEWNSTKRIRLRLLIWVQLTRPLTTHSFKAQV
jgi:ribosomal protein S27E